MLNAHAAKTTRIQREVYRALAYQVCVVVCEITCELAVAKWETFFRVLVGEPARGDIGHIST